MKKLFSPCILATVAALSIGFAASSYAAPPDARPGPGACWGMMGHGHQMFGYGRGMERLHDELKLDEKQEALWKEARDFGNEHRRSMFDRFRKHHDEFRGMLDQPGADLRDITKRMDDLRDQGFQERNAVRDRWLSVYDSLSSGQKEKVRLFFKDKMERMEHFKDEGRGRGRHGGRHDGWRN